MRGRRHKLLSYFFKNLNVRLTREDLLKYLYDDRGAVRPSSNTLGTYIYLARKQLRATDKRFRILTLKSADGMSFMLAKAPTFRPIGELLIKNPVAVAA